MSPGEGAQQAPGTGWRLGKAELRPLSFSSPGQGSTNYGKSQRRGGHQNNYKPY